jgi:hypothetical protein
LTTRWSAARRNSLERVADNGRQLPDSSRPESAGPDPVRRIDDEFGRPDEDTEKTGDRRPT